METLQRIVERVSAQVREHCRARGYKEGPWLNPLVPVDCISAWAMARHLAGAGEIDRYLAVAPEGHVYGFFFEKLGVRVHSVFVDYTSGEPGDPPHLDATGVRERPSGRTRPAGWHERDLGRALHPGRAAFPRRGSADGRDGRTSGQARARCR